MRYPFLLATAALTLASAVSHAQFTPRETVPPIRIIVPPPPDPEEWVEITAGFEHTCARKRNGKVFCWGSNGDKQIGVETNSTCTDEASNKRPCVPRPTLVRLPAQALATPLPLLASQVEAGTRHSCALDTAGKAFCWGSNAYGALANWPRGNASEPLPVEVFGGFVFRRLGAGSGSTCGISDQGVHCWGAIVGNAAQPTRVLPSPTYEDVVVGDSHACVLFVVGSFRQTECFGSNLLQQTGVDPATWSGPVPPTFTSSIGQQTARIAASGNFTCADKQDGTVRCTGFNGSGQLGTGDFQTTFQARAVGGGMALSGVATGWNHACALDAAGRAFCWGNGKYGQLGQGNQESGTFSLPRQVLGGQTFRALAAGFQHTCAISTDNRLWCWGSNYLGQLGLGQGGGWYGVPTPALNPL